MLNHLNPRRNPRRRKVSLIARLLTLILLIKFGNTLVSFRVFSEEFAWVVFNISQLMESSLLPLVCLLLCKPCEFKLRTLAFAILVFNVFAIAEYCLLTFNPTMFYATSTIFVCVLIPVLYRYLSESLREKHVEYSPSGSFLTYKRPRNITGTICALVTAPYGHCSLITDGTEFKYSKGVLVERPFPLSNNLTFHKIPYVELSCIRPMVGMKWSVFNNCFRTFNKFRNPN